MSILLIILVIIAVLIAILLIAALFIKNEFSIKREIIISKPKGEVFNYIRYLKNQENYNKWVMADPNMNRAYRGTDGTVGFVYSWDSDIKQVGKGEQEIRKITGTESIDHEIRFMKPFEGISYANMTTASISDTQTKVAWVFSGIRNYMMRIMHLLFNLKKILGKDLEASLMNLKTILEK